MELMFDDPFFLNSSDDLTLPKDPCLAGDVYGSYVYHSVRPKLSGFNLMEIGDYPIRELKQTVDKKQKLRTKKGLQKSLIKKRIKEYKAKLGI